MRLYTSLLILCRFVVTRSNTVFQQGKGTSPFERGEKSGHFFPQNKEYLQDRDPPTFGKKAGKDICKPIHTWVLSSNRTNRTVHWR